MCSHQYATRRLLLRDAYNHIHTQQADVLVLSPFAIPHQRLLDDQRVHQELTLSRLHTLSMTDSTRNSTRTVRTTPYTISKYY